MGQSVFNFKQFSIYQHKAAMKVCTDACIFGSSIAVEGANSVLDIGAGTGLLSLMIAQRSDAAITAIEIEALACEQAQENIAASPWSSKICAIHTDIQSFAASTTARFDLIVSNPPFFQNNLRSELHARNAAKHNESLSFEALAIAINTLLSADGKCWILLPDYEEFLFADLLKQQKIYKYSQLLVRQRAHEKTFRIISQFGREIPETVVENELYIYNNEQIYTDEFIFLLKDYYL